MKLNFYLLLTIVAVLITACNNASKEDQLIQKEVLSPATNTPTREITIENKADYSTRFISQLYNTAFTEYPVHLIKRKIVIGNTTVYFPHDLNLNQTYQYKALKNDTTFQLELKRINESTLTYTFKISFSDQPIIQENGEADIMPYFYLAPEGTNDLATGESLTSNEYIDESDNSVISIGVESCFENAPCLNRVLISYYNQSHTRLNYTNDNSLVLRRMEFTKE